MSLLLAACLVTVQAPELLDRTLAIVSGHTITLSDARTLLVLGLVDGDAVDAGVLQRLVDRQLMLIEADRYEPPAPPDERIEVRLAEVRARAGGEQALARVLAQGGFTEGRLRAWVRDDLRIASYLQQRFVADERREDLVADWVSDLRRRAQVVILPP
ncbi:MAG: hypothetical protein IT179_13290 [Acidobacteria bacterium]|nr:hypothetical protein [Acidobacteriota bacterium]